MGMGRLGFGQMAAKPAAAAPSANASGPRAMGFGSTGPAKNAAQGMSCLIMSYPFLGYQVLLTDSIDPPYFMLSSSTHH
jgi:hypothetical protein